VQFRDADGAVGRRDFATHWIHWYPAKMFHRIPQAILASLSPQSPLVILDPFCGSGTVLLEGILRGHDVIGIDVNPIARLVSRVKTMPISPAHLRRHMAGIIRRARASSMMLTKDSSLDFWFKPRIRAALHNLFRSLSEIDHAECREFFEVGFSSIIRQTSLADPRIPPPVKLNAERSKTANDKYRHDLKRSENLRVADVYELFTATIEDNLRRMDELHSTQRLGKATVLPAAFEAARSGLPDASVDLVVTSPPYCGAQKYARSLRLEMLMMGITPADIANTDRRTLGTERITKSDILNSPITRFEEVNKLIDKIRAKNAVRSTMLAHYSKYLDDFAKELSRVLRPNGHAFVTFGTDQMSGFSVHCAGIFVRAAAANGLRHVATLVDTIPSRGMITRRHATASTICEEHVVWVRG
jgi:SAM-dependent methyltransferase